MHRRDVLEFSIIKNLENDEAFISETWYLNYARCKIEWFISAIMWEYFNVTQELSDNVKLN